jgi:regulator of sirC expression with transglutaminase-like and TPR domain
MKFAGNTEDYSNPDNSSLEKVLATRKGLPITLSRIVVLVARRLDVPIVGVPASGRYIVKYDGSRAPVGFGKDDIYFHPFEGGKVLSREDRRMLFPSHDPDVMVPPDNNREALTRMLRNLTSHLDHNPERAAQLTRANEMLLMLQPMRAAGP